MSDAFSDNCPYVNAFSNVDCEDSGSAARAIITGESYTVGSKCFMGTLYPTGALSTQYQYCLNYNCQKQTSGKYFLQLVMGSTTATCTAAGSLKVSGYYGSITCPEPTEFCTTVGQKYCKRGCLGRGTCGSDAKCQCYAGYTGVDCGTSVSSVEKAKAVLMPAFNEKDIMVGKEDKN